VIELVLLRSKTRLDVAQALAIGKLRKSHAQVLSEARECFDFVLALVTRYATTKRCARQLLHDLREQQLAHIHQGHPRVISS
jgi:hypothetical protein